MINRRLVVLVAAAGLLGASASANDKVDFDQGVKVPQSVVSSAKKALKASHARASQPMKTYRVAAARVTHAMGFTPHTGGPARSWKTYKDIMRDTGVHSTEIADTFDLRSRLTPIEDQGQCGSCWAFSLTATDRDGHATSGRDPGRLSQEWLVDNSPEADGCNGGDFDSANDLVSPGGEPLWSACPYSAGSGACAKTMAPAPQSSITAWHMLGSSSTGPSVRDIETYMTLSGRPVSIAIAAAAGDWMQYAGGVYNGCTDGQLDHMINIVGWDNEGAAFDKNGNLPAGKGIWILRNSWGTGWGEKGYMRTKMTDAKGVRCNQVAQQAAYFDFAK